MASWILPKKERNSLPCTPLVLRIVSSVRLLEESRTPYFFLRFTYLQLLKSGGRKLLLNYIFFSTVYDGGGTKSKWKSSRDLTSYDKTKQKKEKKRKKPKGKLPKISQGLLDILNLNGDRVNNNSNQVSDSCIETNPEYR